MTEIRGNAQSVEFRNITKIYPGTKVPAVNQVSLDLERGSLVTLLGPSGCGKTTMLRMIAGLELPTSGQILIGDQDVTKLPATDRDVSMVFQSYALFPHMTVAQNVGYGLRFSGFTKREAGERAAAALELVGLGGFGDRLPSQLSGGQQQRVAVARALVLEPQVLLFDEPLSNLDAKLRRRVREEIRDIQVKLELTVAYVTHDQEEALAVSDRIVVMRDAEVAQVGSPRELYEEPADAFVADFIGEANILNCEIVKLSGTIASVRMGPVDLDMPHRGLAKGAAYMAVRPTHIQLCNAGTPGALPGSLSKVTYVGDHLEFLVKTELGDVFVISRDVDYSVNPADGSFRTGADVSLAFAKRGPVLVRM